GDPDPVAGTPESPQCRHPRDLPGTRPRCHLRAGAAGCASPTPEKRLVVGNRQRWPRGSVAQHRASRGGPVSLQLIKNIHTLVTMNGGGGELRDGAVLIRDNVIERVGPSSELTAPAAEVLDLRGTHVVLPGLVNTHHHFYQTLTRVIPAAQNTAL